MENAKGRFMTKFISICFGFIADCRFPRCLQVLINKIYVRVFKIDLSEFAPIDSFKSLNALFTRGLQKMRDFNTNPAIIIAPSDGKITQSGIVQNDLALQIKGFSYRVDELICQNAEHFSYVNIYLSPSNYHRYHAPCDMFVDSITHFKGRRFSVNEKALNKHTNLFIKNERVVVSARDEFNNRIVFVAVGALNVGRIIFYCEPRLSEKYSGKSRKFTYKNPIFLKKGDEIGMFQMGSTIVLFAQNAEILCNNGSKISFGDDLFKKVEI